MPGFCAELAVFTRCLFLGALLDGAWPLPRHARGLLCVLGLLGRVVWDHSVLPHISSRFDLANFSAFCPQTKAFLLECTSLYLHPYLTAGWAFLLGWPTSLGSCQECSFGRGQVPLQDPSWDLFFVSQLSAIHLTSISLLRQASWSPLPQKEVWRGACPWRAPKWGCIGARWFQVSPPHVRVLSQKLEPSFPFPAIYFKSLWFVLAADGMDCNLCPVQALCIHRRWTDSFGCKQCHLLLSWNKSYKGDRR